MPFQYLGALCREAPPTTGHATLHLQDVARAVSRSGGETHGLNFTDRHAQRHDSQVFSTDANERVARLDAVSLCRLPSSCRVCYPQRHTTLGAVAEPAAAKRRRRKEPVSKGHGDTGSEENEAIQRTQRKSSPKLRRHWCAKPAQARGRTSHGRVLTEFG